MRLQALKARPRRRRLPPDLGERQPSTSASGHSRPGRASSRSGQVRFARAPWKGGTFQWVRVPPGNRSSRKQSEQHGGNEVAEAFGYLVSNILGVSPTQFSFSPRFPIELFMSVPMAF
jgi:hypothetical protein